MILLTYKIDVHPGGFEFGCALDFPGRAYLGLGWLEHGVAVVLWPGWWPCFAFGHVVGSSAGIWTPCRASSCSRNTSSWRLACSARARISPWSAGSAGARAGGAAGLG
jgi:hypothetical protein